MKIVLLSGSNVVHTIRWANALAKKGHDVHLIDCHKTAVGLNDSVTVHKLKFSPPLGYFFNANELYRRLIKLKPDIVNVHYASGYGTLSRLSNLGKHFPCVLNLWGSDIYDFPRKSFIHKKIIQKNMLSATCIASTSYCMAEQARKIIGDVNYTFEITPFGVEASKFNFRERDLSSKETIVIGTVKRLMDKYGIDTLIDSFYLLTKKDKTRNYRLILVGEGPQEVKLKKLVYSYGLEHCVEFRGACAHTEVPSVLDELDIFVALSRLDSESFGVAIVEAAFAGVPVVVTDADGPKEVVNTLSNGFIVPKENPKLACDMLYEMVVNSNLYADFGSSGRKQGLKYYEWTDSVLMMESVYKKTINSFEFKKV